MSHLTSTCSMHHPSPTPTVSAGEEMSLLPNFQKRGGGGASQDINFQRKLLGKRGDVFRGGCSFYIKNKLQYLTTKILLKKQIFSVITNKLNWKIFTKNLITLGRWNRIKGVIFEYYRGSRKNRSLGREVSRKTNIQGELPKKRGLWEFADLRGAVTKKGKVFIKGRRYPNAHYVPLLKVKRIYIK